MNAYSISNKESGLSLGAYPGTSEDDALDAFAEHAQYGSWEESCSGLQISEADARAEILVTKIDDAFAAKHFNLLDYTTGTILRDANAAELADSLAASREDGGAGVIMVDGKSCYVA